MIIVPRVSPDMTSMHKVLIKILNLENPSLEPRGIRFALKNQDNKRKAIQEISPRNVR